MKIEYEGVVYDFDFDDITVKQAIKIEKHTGGMTLEEWGKALSPEQEEGEPPRPPDLIALQALGWLILHGGQDIPIDDCDFKLVKFSEAFAEAAEREGAAAQGDPDPTTPAGASTPPMPGSILSATGQPGSPGPDHVSRTGSGLTG